MDTVPLLSVTFIRHGESTDNLRDVWAGWKDSQLSNHGMAQIRALGTSLSATHFTAIYASPLQRTYTTAQGVYAAQPEPKPLFTTSPLLREQHFGIAEGHRWTWVEKPGLTLEEHYAQDIWPALRDRTSKFPEGESLEDVAVRAARAIDELIIPQVRTAVKEGQRGVHIAIVSHGLCISELIPALLMKDVSGRLPTTSYKGLLNTAWTRVTVDVLGEDGQPAELESSDELPPLRVRLTQHNHSEHLKAVKRQPGGVGSAAYDPKQRDIRAFFSGAQILAEHKHEEGRAESNVEDEAELDVAIKAKA